MGLWLAWPFARVNEPCLGANCAQLQANLKIQSLRDFVDIVEMNIQVLKMDSEIRPEVETSNSMQDGNIVA